MKPERPHSLNKEKQHVMRERERERERERADTGLEFFSTFHLLILSCAFPRGLFSPPCIRAPTFWLSSHSLSSLPRHVSWVSNSIYPLTSVWCQKADISVSVGFTQAKKIWDLRFFILVIFNYRSHSPVTGWPKTSALVRVTQKTAGRSYRLSVCFFLLLFFSSLSYPGNFNNLDLAYHITCLFIK